MQEETDLPYILENLGKEYLEVFGLEPSLFSLRRNLIDVLFDKFLAREDFIQAYSVLEGNLLPTVEKKKFEKGLWCAFNKPEKRGIFTTRDSVIYPSGLEEFEGIGVSEEIKDKKIMNRGLINLSEKTRQFLCFGDRHSKDNPLLFALARNKEDSSVELYCIENITEDDGFGVNYGLNDDQLSNATFEYVRKLRALDRDELCALDSSYFNDFYKQFCSLSSDVYKRLQEIKGDIPKERLRKDYIALEVLAGKHRKTKS